jgi:quercetin dioxygenase-like cupin family protein
MNSSDMVAKAAVRDVAGAFEVFEVVAHAAPMTPPHVSPWSAVLYLVEGRITAFVDGASYDVRPGGVVVFPAGTPSAFDVVGESARIVGTTSGDGAGRFFADYASTVSADQPVADPTATIVAVAGATASRSPRRSRSDGAGREWPSSTDIAYRGTVSEVTVEGRRHLPGRDLGVRELTAPVRRPAIR